MSKKKGKGQQWSHKKKEKAQKEREMAFHSGKTAFVAGIILLITMVETVVELFVTMPCWINVVLVLFVSTLIILFLGKKVFDKMLASKNDQKVLSKNVIKFGDLLTFWSLLFYIWDKSVIALQDKASPLEVKIFTIVFVSIGAFGAFYLLTRKFDS